MNKKKQEINQNWDLWKKKYGGQYLGHVSRTQSLLLERKTESAFLGVPKLPILFRIKAKAKTSSQPKQVSFSPELQLAIVSCMEGHKLEFYDCRDNTLDLLGKFILKNNA